MTTRDLTTTIAIQSSAIDLGDGLPRHVRACVGRIGAKYFGRMNAAAVHFGREGAAYRCTVTIDMAGLPMKSALATDPNIYAAFNMALAKLAKQLRRAKRELRDDQYVARAKHVFVRPGLGFAPSP